MVSQYYGWHGLFLFIGRGGRSANHSHSMMQIVISPEKKFHIRKNSKEKYQVLSACVIASNTPHQLVMTNRNNSGIILWLDPEHIQIARWRPKCPITKLELSDKTLALLKNTPANCQEAFRFSQIIIKQVIPGSPERGFDERMQVIFNLIKEQIENQQKISVDNFANKIGLSSSRLMHLFKVETGMTIRRYILWQRKLTAMKNLVNGSTITEAAHNAGFSDAAHLTRTYREFSGVSPSEVWQNSRFVQAEDCSYH